MNILHTSIGKGLTINRGTLKDRPLQVGQASAAPAQAGFPSIPGLTCLPGHLPSPDSRDFRPSRPLQTLSKPGFPALWSWQVSVGSAQALIPGILVLGGLCRPYPGPTSRHSGPGRPLSVMRVVKKSE